jgi:MFS family permease
MELELLRNVLRFDDSHLPPLTSAQWTRVIEAADQERLTLALGLRFGPALPEAIAARAARSLSANSDRFSRARKSYEEIAAALQAAGVEFAVLKGFSHGRSYVTQISDRPQGDLDLFCPQQHIQRAREILAGLGYVPLLGSEDLPTDHVPPMIRKTRWEWRGDYFDPEAPLMVELHFQFWDENTERIALEGLDAFWTRRQPERIDDFNFPALQEADRVGYAALHLIRHLLRGDARLYHTYELAHFLEATHTDAGFWQGWQDLHSPSLRGLESIAFRFASEWFGCRVPEPVLAEWERFPDAVKNWFAMFAEAPLSAKTHPNKNELWLHLALLRSREDRRAVALRRLLPIRRQTARYAAHMPEELVTWRVRVARKAFQAQFTLKRMAHHARATLPTLFAGARFWSSAKGLNSQFFAFLTAAALFNFGMAIYFLLYNLFLLERGFHEDSLGAVSSALGIGALSGTIPAAFGLHRYGLKRLLILAFAGVPLVSMVRVVWTTPEVLIGSALAGGFLFSLYAVSIPPTIAQWTTESARPFAFSLVFSLGIGTGILSGLVGGRLPALWSLRSSLLVACAFATLGSLVATKLKFAAPRAAGGENRIYPRNRFVRRFLTAIFFISLATGAFNPFFSAYFSRALGFQVSEIGVVSAVSQGVQLAAILCAPLVLSRFGAIAGVMSMQLATGVTLALLSLGYSGPVAAGLYALYMGFQYMSEPGTYSLLMDNVAPHERGGAAALNALVVSGTQAVAAVVSGFLVRRLGYAPVLIFAGSFAVLAAIAFRSLAVGRILRKQPGTEPATSAKG